MMSNNQPPVAEVRDGYIKASIWKNEGANGSFYSVTFKNAYKKEGNYHDTDSFQNADCLRLARVAERAYDKIAQLRDAEKQAQQVA